eukprot:647062-Hanusia_phi.AAC.2
MGTARPEPCPPSGDRRPAQALLSTVVSFLPWASCCWAWPGLGRGHRRLSDAAVSEVRDIQTVRIGLSLNLNFSEGTAQP